MCGNGLVEMRCWLWRLVLAFAPKRQCGLSVSAAAVGHRTCASIPLQWAGGVVVVVLPQLW